MSTIFLQYSQAENLKLKHTVILALCILSPLALIGFAFGLSGSYVIVNGYNWWYMTLQPVVLSLIGCLCIDKDRKLKNRAVLALPLKLDKVWDAKVFVCLKFFVYAQLCLLLTLSVIQIILTNVLHVPMKIAITVPSGIIAVIILTVTSIWQIPFVLTLSHKFGFFPALFANMVFSIVGAVEMSLGNLWYLNPYAIPARLMCVVLKILPNNLLAEPGSMTYTEELVKKGQILPGLVIGFLWFVLVWIISRKWYEKKGAKIE